MLLNVAAHNVEVTNVRVTIRKHHITLTTLTFLCFVMFTFWNYYVLKLLRLETITFSDATISDINVVLCYVLLQYRVVVHFKFTFLNLSALSQVVK